MAKDTPLHELFSQGGVALVEAASPSELPPPVDHDVAIPEPEETVSHE